MRTRITLFTSFLLPVISFLFISLLLFSGLCHGQDKNGVSPTTVSLPSGPGSIEGLGAAYQPMLNTGSARYSVPISLPKGTAGHTPSMSLRYESGGGDGPLGLGWSFGPGGISRQVDKGIPRYVDSGNGSDDNYNGIVDDSAELDRFIGPDGEELVEVEPGIYRPRIEGSFVRYRRVQNGWQADLKNGTMLEFGTGVDAQITDSTGQKIFKWLLQKRTDVNGNVIEYMYSEYPGSDNSKYLKEIRYGPGASPWSVYYFISLNYEVKPDWRKDYRSGFLVKTAHRLKQIDVGIQGVLPELSLAGDWNEDSTPDGLISRYILEYEELFQVASQLAKVTRYGSDGVNYLPPISFTYSLTTGSEIFMAGDSILHSQNSPSAVMDNQLVELIDLNRDGLTDILQTDYTGASHTVYLNLGVDETNTNPAISWSDPVRVSSDDELASQLHLMENKVNLADMDGDGLADLVHTSETNEVYYHANRGDLSWGPRNRMSITDTSPPAPAASKDIIVADVDFDKRIDVIQSMESGYAVWFNHQQGVYSSRVVTDGAVSQGRTLLFSDQGVKSGDMNGDRLIDVVKITPAELIYCANQGHGNYAEAVFIPIPGMMLTDGENGQISRSRMSDINGDGLDDLVVERAENDQLWFWLNSGTDTLSEKRIVTGMPVSFGTDVAVRWADMNGNGTTDLVYADSSAANRLQVVDLGSLINEQTIPHLLTEINNGLGVTTALIYRPSTIFYLQAAREDNSWTSTIPFAVQVVAEVRVATSLDLDTVPGADEYVKTFAYRDGFYEDHEKQFRGFGEVTVTEPGDESTPTRVTRHEFFTGGPDNVDNDSDNEVDEISSLNHREEDALKGKIIAVQAETEAGDLFNRSENRWAVRTLLTGSDNVELRYAYKTRSDTIIDEQTDNPETIRSTFVYDDYGNVTQHVNSGAITIDGDEVVTISEYINDTSRWILGLPSHTRLLDTRFEKTAETYYYYDGPPFIGLPVGQLTQGLLTRQEQWITDTTYSDTVRNEYDSYGNIINQLDANGGIRSMVWDTYLHAYPVQENIEVGGGSQDLSIIASFNLGLGEMETSVDFNGNETSYEYDSFGRLTSIVLPGDTPELPTKTFQYNIVDPAAAQLYSYDSQGNLSITSDNASASSIVTQAREVSGQAGTFDTVSYVDGLGRILATVTEGEVDFIVNDTILFNRQGAVRYSFLPYASPTSDYVLPVLTESVVESRYDARGRVIEQINPPDENSLVTSVITQYQPLSQRLINENSIGKTLYRDGRDRIIQVQEENLGETYITAYEYDTHGNLTRITDAQNNVKAMSYDGLGRKTQMEDPDKGHMEYGYDAASNLIRTQDNKNQEILYSYDKANRLLTVDFSDGAARTPDITYHYDIPSADYPDAANLKGRVSSIEDLSGATFFSFDKRGNGEWIINRINDDGTITDYLSRSTYDAIGRVIGNIFPDGDRVNYRYNNRGLLESILGYVDNIDYFAGGLRSKLDLGNNISTVYEYDPRRRLDLLRTTNNADASLLQDLSYTYDGTSNITAMQDNRTLAPDSPQNGSQLFEYDDLQRLTKASGPGYGEISYQYDKIGNMIFKGTPSLPDINHINDPLINLGTFVSGGTEGTSNRGPGLTGGQPGPHAVTATLSGLTYDYDNNGNMISRGTGDSYSWNFENRLIQAATSDSVSSFVYNAGGQRKIKKISANSVETTDYYVNSQYEIRNGVPVKYVFDGTRRIARIQDGEPPSSSEPAEQRFDLEAGWNFIGLHVEPDDPTIADVLSSISGNYSEVWYFDASLGLYQGYVPGEEITDLTEMHAGNGYILNASTPVSLLVSGTRATIDKSLVTGWNLVTSPSNSTIGLEKAMASIGDNLEAVWAYDTRSSSWQSYSVDQPDFLNSLELLSPDKSYWVKVAAPVEFTYQPRRVNYYHTDHLGSSSLVSDESGTVVEETAFYPFGRPRYEERTGFDSAYKYTGKELDKATGLMYYEARYYDPVVSRFVSVDPLYAEVGNISNGYKRGPQYDSQLLNLYSYTINNPVNMVDPTGLEPRRSQELMQLYEYQLQTYDSAIEQQQVVTNKSVQNYGEKWRGYGKEKGRRVGLEQTPKVMFDVSMAYGAGAGTKGGGRKGFATKSTAKLKIYDHDKFMSKEEEILAGNSAGPEYQFQKLRDEEKALAEMTAAEDVVNSEIETLDRLKRERHIIQERFDTLKMDQIEDGEELDYTNEFDFTLYPIEQ